MRKMLICLGILISIHSYTTAAEFPEIRGWKSTNEVTHYTPENLWEYINGAADQFLDYRFQFLRSRKFKSNATRVTIDNYDMGIPLNAFAECIPMSDPSNIHRLESAWSLLFRHLLNAFF